MYFLQTSIQVSQMPHYPFLLERASKPSMNLSSDVMMHFSGCDQNFACKTSPNSQQIFSNKKYYGMNLILTHIIFIGNLHIHYVYKARRTQFVNNFQWNFAQNRGKLKDSFIKSEIQKLYCQILCNYFMLFLLNSMTLVFNLSLRLETFELYSEIF